MRAAFAALALVLGLAPLASAQQSVVTTPVPATTKGGNASSTIGTGGSTFQLVFASTTQQPGSSGTASNGPSARRGCTIINNGTHTMYVTEGLGAAASTTTLATQLTAGQAYYCGNLGGPVLTGEIDITGTAGDAFYAAQY